MALTIAPVDADPFYSRVAVFNGFGRITERDLYVPLPAGWVVGATDVVNSTAAVEEGRYKTVNTAGASVIAALSNALGQQQFPFVFGGDGASFAVPAAFADLARETLAATAAWSRDELELPLRAALVPIEAIREAGHDVLVARFAASDAVSYAMFTGGGLAFVEREMKQGRFAVEPGPPGAKPDLSNLSCRFDEIPAARGVILSLIVVPRPSVDLAAFAAFVMRLLALIEQSGEAAQPMASKPLAFSWPPKGFDLEVRSSGRPGTPLWVRRLLVGARTLISYLIFIRNRPIGTFDPSVYLKQQLTNSDFRKYDDGLRMTIDCTAALADRIEAMLQEGDEAGTANFGLHRQAAALMTCFVPSVMRSDHVHFIDGAAGGYSSAAKALKSKI